MLSTENKSYNFELSIIIPVKDEKDNIVGLAEELNDAMVSVAYPWECIWVDDGSTDTTLRELEKICTASSRHRFLSFSKNYGQSAALYAGFRFAKGRLLGTLDGDGQNDPKDLPALVSCIVETDADMVNGVRQNRKDTFIRKISSKIGNGFRNRLTGENITDVGCSMRVFKHVYIRNVPSFKSIHRFLPTLMKIAGASNIIEMPVNHRPRMHGKTKYGIGNRMWVGIIDTMAVRWMQSRFVFADIESTSSQRNNKKNTDE